MEKVHREWQTQLIQNLEQSEALLKERPAFLGLNWTEVRSALLFQWGAFFLSRNCKADELDMRIRICSKPPAVSLYSPVEAVRERLKKKAKQPTNAEEQERLHRCEAAIAILQAQKADAAQEEQWMIAYCTAGILEYTQDLLTGFPNLSAEELAEEVKKQTAQVSANRAVLEEKINALHYGEDWKRLILEKAVEDMGSRMLIQTEQKELLDVAGQSFRMVDRAVYLSEQRAEALAQDDVLQQIPNLIQIPEIQTILFADADTYKVELKALKFRVERNLNILKRALADTAEDAAQQEQLEKRVLQDQGRLLLWKLYNTDAVKELIHKIKY